MMTLRDSYFDERVRLTETTLSDGSTVYGVRIDTVDIPCYSQATAMALISVLKQTALL